MVGRKHTFTYALKSIGVNDRSVDIVISEMSSKVGGSGVEASEVLIFMEICIDFVGPGERFVKRREFEFNW